MSKKTKSPKRTGRQSRGRSHVKQLSAVPLESLLSPKTDRLSCTYLPEPELLFAGKERCVDPRTGLAAFGPYSKSDATRRDQIRIGIVGPADAIDRAVALLTQIQQPIEQNEKIDCMLHPSFPGFNSNDPFQVQLVTQSVWHRPMRALDVRLVEHEDDFARRVGLLKKFAAEEVAALGALDPPPDVVICAMSQKLEELCRTGIAEYDRERAEVEELLAGDTEDVNEESTRSFRRGLKAECMNVVPTQLMWHKTLAGTRGVQDLPTVAWNLTTALMYKARIVPWRLADVLEGACFIGMSFYHEDEARSPFLRTSIAQAFTERGEGFVLRGDSVEWDERKEQERAPHLSEEQAKSILSRVLDIYEKQVGAKPRKVVLHKTSRYSAEERAGFESALSATSHHALLTLSQRRIVCLRPGYKPVLRGTSVDFGEKKGLVYTTGYVPFLRCYSGFRIPQPIEITENFGSLTFRECAEDILRLTKLNWNTSDFSTHDPITLAFSRRVGEILKLAGSKDAAVQYRYYM
ncbi:MAG TPA: hypothetical protein VJT08_18130 [Terriglobales bacterium]|nr:hypothetical protein [Terriglobales bacterium]